MKTALGFGLVLLTVAAPCALAGAVGASSTDQTAAAFSFFLSGPGSSSARTAQGYLGVSVRDVTPDQLPALKLKDARGAEIILVDHDAPAGKAGLREHDVVLQINGQTIAGKDQLSRMLHESAPGRSITLVISRDGQQMTITTQMAVSQEEVERQASEQRTKVPEPPPAVSDNADSTFSAPSSAPARGNSFIGTLLMNPSYTGVVLEKMSTQQAAYFGVPSGIGLLVRSVVPNSPAALAGLQACDVIEKADEHPIATSNDWTKVLKNSHGHPLTVIVMRDKKEQTISLTPDGKKRSSIGDEPAQPQQYPDPTAVARLFLPRS
jgi:serine protease Do